MRKRQFFAPILVPVLLASSGYGARAADPPVSAQSATAAALGAAAKARVTTPAAAPTVKPGDGGRDGAASTSPDLSVTPDICGKASLPNAAPLAEPQRLGCRVYMDWVNQRISDNSRRNSQAATPVIIGGKVMTVTYSIQPESPRSFTFRLPYFAPTTSPYVGGSITHFSAWRLDFVMVGGQPYIEAEVTPYGQDEPVKTRYRVNSGEPLRIMLGEGDFVTVTPEFTDASANDVALNCRNRTNIAFRAANPAPSGTEQSVAFSNQLRATQTEVCN